MSVVPPLHGTHWDYVLFTLWDGSTTSSVCVHVSCHHNTECENRKNMVC